MQRASLFDLGSIVLMTISNNRAACGYDSEGRKWEEPFDGQIPSAGSVAAFILLLSA